MTGDDVISILHETRKRAREAAVQLYLLNEEYDRTREAALDAVRLRIKDEFKDRREAAEGEKTERQDAVEKAVIEAAAKFGEHKPFPVKGKFGRTKWACSCEQVYDDWNGWVDPKKAKRVKEHGETFNERTYVFQTHLLEVIARGLGKEFTTDVHSASIDVVLFRDLEQRDYEAAEAKKKSETEQKA